MQERGHCQVCGKQHAVTNGTMAIHGYTVAFGWFNGRCAGEHFAPVEHSRIELDRVVAEVRKECATLREIADRMERGEAHPLTVQTGRCVRNENGKKVPELIRWEDASEAQRTDGINVTVWSRRSRAKQGEQFALDLEAVANAFHGKPLLEVARDPRPVPITRGEVRKTTGGVRLVCQYQQGARVYYKVDGRQSWMGAQAWRKLEVVQNGN